MPETSPRATVVVVQRETFAHTYRSIESLYATAGAPFDCIYVDGGSPPAVQRVIAEASARHGFRVLRYDRFLTQNEARNLALPLIATDFVAFVDNDLLFRDGWLRLLIACLEETGADIAGPLVCIDEPPFTKIHVAGGNAHIVEGAAGREFRVTHRFGHAQVDAVAAQLVREPLEMVELHCMLVRRTALERVGPFDEEIRTANEHLDLCMLVRQNGGTIVFEPAAAASQLLPRVFPLDRQSLPFFYERWSERNNRITIDRFRAKWNLRPDDRTTEATYHWCNDRRDVVVRYLKLTNVRHGLRKLQRISRRLAARLT